MKSKSLERSLVILVGVAMLGFGLYLQKPSDERVTEELNISFLNVGQGDATLFKTPNNQYVLIDGGPDKKILSELGEVMPPNQRKIDTLILSHPHADHVAGLNYVLDRYQVEQIYLTGAVHNSPDYIEFLQKIKEQNIAIKKSFAGEVFERDDVSFKFLYPEADISGQSFKDQNDGSNVVDVSYKGRHLLMLGDLPKNIQEKSLLPGLKDYKYDIIKVSHHGSKTGTSSLLIDQLKPKYSVITVGKNRFGHPSPLTLAQLTGTIVKRTDQEGRIEFVLNSSGLYSQ